MTSRKKALLAGTTVLVVGLAVATVHIRRIAAESTMGAYASQGAGELLIWHLRMNTNQWPQDWAALARTYDELERSHSELRKEDGVTWRVWDISMGATFTQISNHVAIDWSATATNLLRFADSNALRPFSVVRLKSGKGTHWQGLEPNRMILEYLRTSVATNSSPLGSAKP